MTAAHCFDNVNAAYDSKKFVYVGTHLKRDNTTGQKIGIASVEGIDKDGKPVNFPVDPKVHNISNNTLDVAILTLENDIKFTENITKVSLQSPRAKSDDCLSCSGDCDPNNILMPYGWGDYKSGININ